MENKEAIELLKGVAVYADREFKNDLNLAIAALEQQEKAFDEWCTDCKEYDKERHCCHRFTKVIRQAVEEHRRECPDSKWTPVSEALPKEKAEYNVTIKGEYGLPPYVDACYWNDNDNVFEDWNGYYEDYIPVSNVIAWRPLPEPYMEDEA